MCNVSLFRSLYGCCLLSVKEAAAVIKLPTVTITTNNSLIMKGEPYTINCRFSQLQQNIAFQSLALKFKRSNIIKGHIFIKVYPSGSFSFGNKYKYFGFAASSIHRHLNIEETYMSLTLPEVTCRNVDISFWCNIVVIQQSNGILIEDNHDSEMIKFEVVGMLRGFCYPFFLFNGKTHLCCLICKKRPRKFFM